MKSFLCSPREVRATEKGTVEYVVKGKCEFTGEESEEEMLRDSATVAKQTSIPFGYVRKESRFVVSPNGKTLEFLLVDEPMAPPEFPADEPFIVGG